MVHIENLEQKLHPKFSIERFTKTINDGAWIVIYDPNGTIFPYWFLGIPTIGREIYYSDFLYCKVVEIDPENRTVWIDEK